MSILSYNSIQLQVCRMLRGTERTPIYDGPTYLYTRWRIVCRCLFNPQATSYDFPVRPDIVPGAAPIISPNVPAQTDQMIRHRLLIPRGQLILGIGNVAWLVSPQQGFTVDSSNGPTPLFCNIVRGPGGRSFVVDYGIETCLRECNLETTTYPSIFLSHRWTMQHEIDDDFFTSRIIDGHVIFDTARLKQGGVNPDDYRSSFFHPVPTSFQRKSIVVVANADGNSVDYSITDEELEINIGAKAKAAGVTRIEASHSASMSTPGITKQIYEGVKALASIIGATLGGMAAGGALAVRSAPKGQSLRARHARRQLPAQIRAGRIRGGITGAISATFTGAESIAAVLPVAIHKVSARVWGKPSGLNINKRALEGVAVGICKSRIDALLAKQGIFIIGTENVIEWDLAGMYVEAHATGITTAAAATLDFAASGAIGAGIAAIGVIPAAPDRWPLMPVSEEVDAADGGFLTVGDVVNPIMGDGLTTGNRSRYMEHIVTQALLAPCVNQTPPRTIIPANESAINLNQSSSIPL